MLDVFEQFELAARDSGTAFPLVPRLLLSIDRSGGAEAAHATVALASRLRAEGGDTSGGGGGGGEARRGGGGGANAFEWTQRARLAVRLKQPAYGAAAWASAVRELEEVLDGKP